MITYYIILKLKYAYEEAHFSSKSKCLSLSDVFLNFVPCSRSLVITGFCHSR